MEEMKNIKKMKDKKNKRLSSIFLFFLVATGFYPFYHCRNSAHACCLTLWNSVDNAKHKLVQNALSRQMTSK